MAIHASQQQIHSCVPDGTVDGKDNDDTPSVEVGKIARTRYCRRGVLRVALSERPRAYRLSVFADALFLVLASTAAIGDLVSPERRQ
jgi:hypothetical protein